MWMIEETNKHTHYPCQPFKRSGVSIYLFIDMDDGVIEEVLLVVLSLPKTSSIVLHNIHFYTHYSLDATKPLQHQCGILAKS